MTFEREGSQILKENSRSKARDGTIRDGSAKASFQKRMPEDSYYCSVCDMQPARALCHGFRAWALHHGFWARALCHGSVGFASPPQADGPAFCRTISRPIIGPNTQKKTLQLINNNTLEVKDPKQQDLEICKMTKSGAYNLGDYTSRTTDLESGKALTCVGKSRRPTIRGPTLLGLRILDLGALTNVWKSRGPTIRGSTLLGLRI